MSWDRKPTLLERYAAPPAPKKKPAPRKLTRPSPVLFTWTQLPLFPET